MESDSQLKGNQRIENFFARRRRVFRGSESAISRLSSAFVDGVVAREASVLGRALRGVVTLRGRTRLT